MLDFKDGIYSVTFLTPALGAWLLLHGATRNEQQTLGLTLAAWGVLPIFALIWVDATVKPVHWELTGTWLWLALFAGMAGVGWWLVASTRQTMWEKK